MPEQTILALYSELKERVQRLEALILGEPLDEILPPTQNQKAETKRKAKLTADLVLKTLKKKTISHSEMVCIAQLLGHEEASKVMPYEDLLSAISGEPVTWYGDPMQEQREKTHEYTRNRDIAISLVKCDLNCPECPAHRVAMCWTENGKSVERYHREQEI